MTLTGVSEVLEGLNDLKVDGKQMKKHLKMIIRKVMSDARKRMTVDAKTALPNDPRRAYMAVRHSVYKRILGGQVNILNKRAGRLNSKMSVYHPPRTLRAGQRGGNRRKRSSKTDRIDGYYGNDRGFILRFVNSGTIVRDTRYGSRGSIKARNWFGTSATKVMNKAAEELSLLIERAINEVWTEESSSS